MTRWHAWSERLATSTLYDALMRIPVTVWTLATLVHEVFDARSFIAGQVDRSDPTFLLALLARASLMALLAFQGAMFIARRRPVARSIGFYPRVIAILGATLPISLVFLHRPPTGPILNIASVALIILGNYLSVLVVSRLGRSLSILPEGRRLVTTGPYSLVRHPLYVTEQIAVLGIFLQFLTVWAALILSVHLVCQFLRMREEEIVLGRAFAEYADYRRRTPYRFIPGLI